MKNILLMALIFVLIKINMRIGQLHSDFNIS